jgi:hypothetical protein
MNPTPHDALVRAIFGQPHHAAAELGEVLPASVAAALDLGSLVPVDASFVDERLRASAADLVFAARFRDGSPARLLFLIEHQSTLDRRLPIRLLAYQTRLLEEWDAEHGAGDPPPGIVAVVIHQGPRPWPWPRSYQAASGCSPAAQRCGSLRLLDFDFLVDDLAALTDEQLLSRGRDVVAKLTWFALRHGRDPIGLIERMVGALHALDHDLRGPRVGPALVRLVRYVCDVSETPLTAVRQAFAAAIPSGTRSSFMKVSDALRAEGRIEGRVEAFRESLLDQIGIRFGAADAATHKRIGAADGDQLRAWLRKFAVAKSLADIFAG